MPGPTNSTLFPYTTLFRSPVAEGHLHQGHLALFQAQESDEVAHRDRLFDEGGEQEKRSEEHTSELQSRGHLVCRLLLEKKKLSKILHKKIDLVITVELLPS